MSENKPKCIPLSEAQAPFYAGIDLGGTNIKVGVVDDLGRPVSFLTVPTLAENGPEDSSQRMGRAVLDAIDQAGIEPSAVPRVGLGSPGTMDIPKGRLVKPVNLKGWDDFPLRDRVSHHCGLPVTFANDAAAAAFGEYWAGAGRGTQSLVLFTLGTGVGCGIIIDDVSIDGVNSHGAECGHIIINDSPDARMCGCGQRGHLEAYASATGVTKLTQELLDAGETTSLRDRVNDGAELTPKLVSEEAEKNDALSLRIVKQVASSMGVGVVNLLHTIDPNAVLIGGAMTFGGAKTELGRQFLAWIKEEVDRRAFALLAERIKLDFAELGGDAGFIGAAGMGRVDYRKGK